MELLNKRWAELCTFLDEKYIRMFSFCDLKKVNKAIERCNSLLEQLSSIDNRHVLGALNRDNDAIANKIYSPPVTPKIQIPSGSD